MKQQQQQQHTGGTHGDVIKRLVHQWSKDGTNTPSLSSFWYDRTHVGLRNWMYLVPSLTIIAPYFLHGVIHDINPEPLCLNIWIMALWECIWRWNDKLFQWFQANVFYVPSRETCRSFVILVQLPALYNDWKSLLYSHPLKWLASAPLKTDMSVTVMWSSFCGCYAKQEEMEASDGSISDWRCVDPLELLSGGEKWRKPFRHHNPSTACEASTHVKMCSFRRWVRFAGPQSLTDGEAKEWYKQRYSAFLQLWGTEIVLFRLAWVCESEYFFSFWDCKSKKTIF